MPERILTSSLISITSASKTLVWLPFSKTVRTRTKQILLILLTLSFTGHSYARSRDRIGYVNLNYTSYNDLKRASGGATATIDSTLDLELGIRLKNLFSFILIGFQSEDKLRNGVGAGFRVDTPGFFWFGGRFRQLTVNKKNYPINTSIFGYYFQSTAKTSASSTAATSTGSNMGIATDIFLFNPYVYLSLQVSIYNEAGNAYSAYTAGLGTEF